MPIHPVTIHFPIVIILMVMGLCIWRLFKDLSQDISRLTLYLFAFSEVSLLVTILTGRASGQELQPTEALREVLELHELLGYAVIWANGLLLIWMYLRNHRWKRPELLAFVGVLAAVCILMLLSSHLGGRMVYEFGAGVLNAVP